MVSRTSAKPGIALLATMLAIALMTLLVVDFTTEASLDYRSAANQINDLRAYYLARSGVQVGVALLAEQARMNAGLPHPYFALTQPWAAPFPPLPVEGGTASVTVVDDARKLNINQLVDPRSGQVNPQFLAVLTNLFGIIGVDPGIIPAIVDWLDPDSVESVGGAEADYYMQLVPPYAPRNGPMPTLGDLRMVRGVNTPIFMLLSQFLTAAPEYQVNANTAPPAVLAALDPALAANPNMIKEILLARSEQPFQTVLDVANLPDSGQVGNDLMKVLTTTGSYFTITATGTYAASRRLIQATVRLNPNGTAMLVSWREL